MADVFDSEKRDRSLTDYLYEIHEMAGHSPLLTKILEQNLYENLPDDARKKLNKITGECYIPLLDKKKWKCCHLGCEEDSCLSHEISASIFISQIENDNKKVYILKPTLETNPLLDKFSEVYTNSATAFPGYCSYHDRELFKDIDGGRCDKNVFYNKQSLRTLHREKFEIKLKILMAQSIIESMKENDEFEEYYSEQINYFNEKIEIAKERLENVESIYGIVYCGIVNKEYKIKYQEFDVKKRGYLFASFFDLTDYKSNDEACFVFLYKINFENSPKLAICYLDNVLSENAATELHKEIRKPIMGCLLHAKRKRLVFSAEFIKEISPLSREILTKDEEIFPIGPIEQILLALDFID